MRKSMKWYRVVQFDCPVCGQRLAVFQAQVERGETVVCERCNTDLVLAAKLRPRTGVQAAGTDRRVVEIPV